MSDFKFALGEKVIELMSGISGLIDACAEWQSGSIQFSVQRPLSDTGEQRQTLWMDDGHMELLPKEDDDGIKPIPVNEDWDFELGDLVFVVASDFKGIIIGRAFWINGCFKYYLRSTKSNKDGELPTQWFDAVDLHLSPKPMFAKDKPKAEPKKRTGGPSSPSNFNG